MEKVGRNDTPEDRIYVRTSSGTLELTVKRNLRDYICTRLSESAKEA